MALTPDEEFELLRLERERSMSSSNKSGDAPKEKGIISKAWDALSIPEKKSREGLNLIADAIPSAEMTGNIVRDVALNSPKAIAETLAVTAPDFISRGSIATAGLLKGGKMAAPLIKGVGKAAAKAAEGISGLEYKTPGVLSEAAKDPTLIFSKGKKAASDLYETARTEMGGSNIFKGMYKPEEIVDAAKDYMAKGGVLEPSEGLAFRKAIDKLLKSGRYVKDELMALRKEGDLIAKRSEAVKMADPIYARGVRAEALRLPFAQNKTGGSSIAKGILGVLGGGLPNVAMSPLFQGMTATSVGALAKLASKMGESPIRSAAASNSAVFNLLRILNGRDF